MEFIASTICAFWLCNGSFEHGLTGWHLFGQGKFVTGVCGKNALRLDGAIQSDMIQVRPHETYQITFKYRGKRLRSTGLMDLPPVQMWQTAQYTIAPQGNNLMIGFEGHGVIDCVEVIAK